MKPTPEDAEGWLQEIAAAYADAKEAIPYGKLLGDTIEEDELFAIAPFLALKFRDIPATEQNYKRATDAAFASCLANKDEHPDELGSPQLSFAFAYLASHHGLELASPEVVNDVMEHVHLHRDRLAARAVDEEP